jgi:flavin-dependent thymidylate synthase
MTKACLVSVTPDAEKTMAYIARVSNPSNQDNPNFAKLLKYCIDHQHWSVFEQSTMTLEIETTLDIATQILRHRSFCFQQFSQRYADASLLTEELPVPELRKQDTKNRQNSTDDLDPELKRSFERRIKHVFADIMDLYDDMLTAGVAKECARKVLPQNTPTRIYMTGSCRSWVHYIGLREKNGTQAEHMEVAEAAKRIFVCQFPSVAEALGWCDGECDCKDWENTQPCIRID